MEQRQAPEFRVGNSIKKTYNKERDMKPKVYLAGPISGFTFEECVAWRDQVKKELAKAGIEGISPLRAKEYLLDAGTLTKTGYEKIYVRTIKKRCRSIN